MPDCPEQEGKSSSQTCSPLASLDATVTLSSVTREIESKLSSALPLPPDSRNTTSICDLPKKRKRQTSPDTPPKKHWGINGATSDASKLGDNNFFVFQSKAFQFPRIEDKTTIIVRPVASFTSESSRIEFDETLPSNAPMPKVHWHDPQRGDEAHPAKGKQKSPSNFRATKKTSVLAPPPKDATRQPKQYETTSNPKKRRASNSEGHQRKRQEVPVDQEDSIPVIYQPDLAKKNRGRPPKVKEGQEGPTSGSVQPARRKKKGQSSHAVSGLQETVEGFSRLDHVPCSMLLIIMLDRSMKEDINRSENWLWPQKHVMVEEDFILEDQATTQLEDCPLATASDIIHTHKPPLCVNPPIWAQVRDNTLRYNKLSSAILSSPAKKFVKPFIGSGAIKVVFILRTMQ
jgi:hypothetical protein